MANPALEVELEGVEYSVDSEREGEVRLFIKDVSFRMLVCGDHHTSSI